jgi:hypothetical protein
LAGRKYETGKSGIILRKKNLKKDWNFSGKTGKEKMRKITEARINDMFYMVVKVGHSH